MRHHRWIVSIAALALMAGGALRAAFGAEAADAQFVLVRGGADVAPIVIFKDAPPMTRQAADELAQYIEKVSGARPQVIEGEPQPLPAKAIWVGYQPALKELFPKVDFEFKHPEEILITTNGKHLVIAGRDRWDPKNLVVKTSRSAINGKQLEYGTINAVYTFLQDHLGVRWLWPGEIGEDIVKKDTIIFAPFEYRYHPQLRQRGGLFRLSALGDSRGVSSDWTRLQRLQLDSLDVDSSHAFTTWWEKYHKDHPEYFALQPDGTRSGFPEPGKVKICQASPAVWKQWLDNVAEELKNDPYQITFSASPNDSWNRGHCVCDLCRAWDNPDGVLINLTWQGLYQEYVSLTDRQVTFANTLGRLLKERFPGHELYVAMHAYGDAYQRPPVAVVPDDNVIISCVNSFFIMDNAEARNYFAGWGKIAPHIIWRPNTGSAAGWQQGQPDVPLTMMMENIRFAADNRCKGIYVDTVWEHWPTTAPLYYLMAQMTWNPWADGKAILEDYYQRGFGPAAPAIKEYWALLEDARNRKVNEKRDFASVYDAALFTRATELLDRAHAALADAPEIYRKRVAFVRVGLEYTRLMVDTRAAMDRWAKSREKDKAAADQARENWKAILAITKDKNNLMNVRYLTPGSRYTQGLHPDFGTGKK